MEYTSTIASMLHNPNHMNYQDTCYRTDYFSYRLLENTLYHFTSVWCRDFRNYLQTNGIVVPDDKRMYTPVASLIDGELIGYNTQYANMGNKFLDMRDGTREIHFPNLYFVEVGNHPYPKEARYHHSWLIENYHRECHKILNPPSDPTKFFLQPTSFAPTLRPS